MEQNRENQLRAYNRAELELWAAVKEARAKYETAKAAFNDVCQQAYGFGLSSADGSHALFNATRAYNFALKAYTEAMERLSAFLLHRRKSPE